MILGLTLTAAGAMLMYLAVTDADMKDVVEGFLSGQIIVRKDKSLSAPKSGSTGPGKSDTPGAGTGGGGGGGGGW